ncbi:calcium-binding protein, partial [Phaeobacter marinintestinus]|uniref:calcium-binding protein n=1 Tax=Falsiphaeobacter marinintestinus TaxID=1492905 RepID=UPI0011B3D24E
QSASGGSAEGDVISGFEKVFGSAHADDLTGDAADNQLVGWLGADTLNGGDGNDILRGDAGADIMDGGDDEDWVMYFGSTAGVTVSLVEDGFGFQSATGGDATGDVISNFERVWGSDHADDLTGNDGDNYLLGRDGDDVMDGGAGNDTMRGGVGADTMEGGADTDLIAYNTSAVGVTVDLTVDGFGFQSASGGTADGDVISGFENVAGTAHADDLTGDDGANILLGLGGDDTMDGGGGSDILRGGAGADTMVGGTGNDWVQYAGSSSGVTVNLSEVAGFQSASGGDADGDVISGFEYVFGSAHDDDLTGNASANVLLGGDG